ncbi:MAG: hypothetical protein R8M45_06560 [Ghiorsea sp.]
MIIDGVEYIKKSETVKGNPEGLRYCMVRTQSAGVFCGFVSEASGTMFTVLNARRMYYWAGAATLSQLSQEGTTKPSECKFPCEVPEVLLLGVLEVIPMTEQAIKSIASVAVWRA